MSDETLPSEASAVRCRLDRVRVHPLLASRFSPTRFDPGRELSAPTVEVLLEAARWAPSAGNSQPWAFIVGKRGDATHARLVRHLAGSSALWAPAASLLVVNLAHRYVEDTEWEYSEFSVYDLGQAVAHMTVQAEALGISVRQFRAFDKDALTREFTVPAHWEVITMSAYGSPASGARAKSTSRRQRRDVGDLLWPAARDAPRSA